MRRFSNPVFVYFNPSSHRKGEATEQKVSKKYYIYKLRKLFYVLEIS